MVVLLASAQHKADMTNVVPFVSRAHAGLPADPAVAARATASVVADLVDVVAEIREISGRVPSTPLTCSPTTASAHPPNGVPVQVLPLGRCDPHRAQFGCSRLKECPRAGTRC